MNAMPDAGSSERIKREISNNESQIVSSPDNKSPPFKIWSYSVDNHLCSLYCVLHLLKVCGVDLQNIDGIIKSQLAN